MCKNECILHTENPIRVTNMSIEQSTTHHEHHQCRKYQTRYHILIFCLNFGLFPMSIQRIILKCIACAIKKLYMILFYLFFIPKFQDDGFAAGSDWTNIIIPGESRIGGSSTEDAFHHEKSFPLSDLIPEAEYECLVQAKNIYGWSEASRIHRFYTHYSTYGKFSLHI